MAKFVGTLARVNPKSGVAEHKHGDSGWHWACAGHRDDGALHAQFKASTPTFEDGMSASQKANYLKALNREEGFVSMIASTSEKAPRPAVLVKA